MFKFFLNGVEVTEHPDGWDNMVLTTKRDDLSGGLYWDAEINLRTFGGQYLFNQLKTKWTTDRYGTSTFDVYQRSGLNGYIKIHSGTIFHSDIKYELINNYIDFKVDDTSWFSLLNNNKGIDVTLGSTLSKNGVNITPASSFDLEVHKVSNGTYYAQQRKAFKVYDALHFLVEFMSDGKVDFASDCFGVGGVYEYYCLVNGHELWAHDGVNFPRLSFGGLFEDLKKRFNVRFAMIYSGPRPTLRIEPADYFYDQAISHTLSDIPGSVLTSVDTGSIYAGARIGSDKFDSTSSLTLPDIDTLLSFREANVTFQGVNNVESELDLVGSLIVSNALCEIVVEQLSGHDSYEEDTFLIHYNSSLKTVSTNWIGTSSHLYNETLNNYNTLQRWSGYIPGNVINTEAVATGSFKAVQTIPTPGVPLAIAGTEQGPYRFDDDYTSGYDPNVSYGGATAQGSPVSAVNSIYTAAASGNYSFTAQIAFNVINQGTSFIQIRFKKFNAGNVVIDDNTGPVFQLPQAAGTLGFPPFTLNGSWNTYLNAGEYIAVYTYVTVGNVFLGSIPYATYFTSGGKNGSGLVISSDPKSYKAIKASLTFPLTLDDYITIRDSKSGLISIPLSNNTALTGWVDTIKFNTISGDTSFTLTTDGNTISR